MWATTGDRINKWVAELKLWSKDLNFFKQIIWANCVRDKIGRNVKGGECVSVWLIIIYLTFLCELFTFHKKNVQYLKWHFHPHTTVEMSSSARRAGRPEKGSGSPGCCHWLFCGKLKLIEVKEVDGQISKVCEDWRLEQIPTHFCHLSEVWRQNGY